MDRIEIKFGDISINIPTNREDFEMAHKLLVMAAEYLFGQEPLTPPITVAPTPVKREEKETETKEKKKRKREGYYDVMASYEYEVDKDDNRVRVWYKPNDRTVSYRRFTYSFVKDLFESMPDRFNITDLYNKVREMGYDMTRQECAMIMRVFTYVDFNAELKRIGRDLVAIKIKDNGSLNEENKKKMDLEKDLVR